jgi:predicted XRE-type DNA-binding protein
MKKIKLIKAKNASDLAEALGLSPADAMEMEIRSDLNSKIIDVIQKKKLTHLQVAHLVGSSRTRVTAIMNRNTQHISTDLMLRVLGALGVHARIKFDRAA